MGHLEAVSWKPQPQLAPKWFMDKLSRGDAASHPLPQAGGSERCRSASEMASRRDINAEKRSHGKGRRELFAKTAQMTTAALIDNLDGQGNQACAIEALQDEVECRDEEMGDSDASDVDALDEEMDDAKKSEREVICKPRLPTSTFALSHAMSAVDPPDSVLISATDLAPRSVSAFCINSLTARVLTKVPVVSMVDSTSVFSTTPLRSVHCASNALLHVVLGGHQAQPTVITFRPLWEHMVRFNQLRVSQG